MPPPAFAMAAPPPNPETDLTPPHVAPDQEGAAGEYGGGGEYGGAPTAEQGDSDEYGSMPPPTATEDKPKPSITDLMKNPSKVVLCKVIPTLKNLQHNFFKSHCDLQRTES